MVLRVINRYAQHLELKSRGQFLAQQFAKTAYKAKYSHDRCPYLLHRLH
jgi:hypothetical protein